MLGLSRKLSFEVERSPDELKTVITQYLSGKRGADAMSYAVFEGSITPEGFRFEEDHSWRPRGWIRILTMDGRIKQGAGGGADVSVRLSTTKGWVKTNIPLLIVFAGVIAFLWFDPMSIEVPAELKLSFIKFMVLLFALYVIWDYLDRLFILWRRAKKIAHDLPFLLRNYGRHSQLDAGQ